MLKEVITDIFFDLDHTLWDFERNSELTFRKILSDNSVDVPLEDFIKVYAPINLAHWKLYREDRISKPDLRYLRLRKTFDALQCQVTDALIQLLARQYIEQLSSFSHLLPHTLDILEYLKPGYRLHIITNGFQEVQEKKLRNANIRGYFQHIIDSEMAGVKKPDPHIFLLALERAGVPADKALMVGDNLEADILGARAVGFHTLHLNVHKDPVHEYCNIITGLDEIKHYV